MLLCKFFQAETALGVKLDQVEVNEHNVSEVLRLFILARNAEPNEVCTTYFSNDLSIDLLSL